MKVQTYSDNPLGSQGNSKENQCQPTPLPNTTDPCTSLVVAVACKKKRERRWAHLVGFDNCLTNLVSFPPLKAVGTGQVAIVKKNYTTGQIAVP